MTEKLILFRNEFIEEIRNDALLNSVDVTSQFLEMFTDNLITAEEILEFEESDVKFNGKANRKAEIDGYTIDGLEKSLSLFVADFSNNEELGTLTQTTINTLSNRAIYFLEMAVSNYIHNNLEESSVVYQLSELIKERLDNINKIKIYILSDSMLSKQLKKINIDDFDSKKVEVIVWDIERLYNLIQSSLKKESLEISLTDKSDLIPCIKAVDNELFTSYLAVINGLTLGNLYLEHGPQLLEGNVRSFLSVRGKINKGIRNTIRDEADVFFVYNNGIACTATDATVVENGGFAYISSVTNLQIINGGQTTASIANSIIQDKAYEKVKNISVPMKLTIIKDAAVNEAEENVAGEINTDELINQITSNIAKYANSQNKVDESDFFSNHPYHVRFENLARTTYAPAVQGNLVATIWFYERAKGQYIQEQMKLTKSEKKRFEQKYPKKQLVRKIDLAKYLMIHEMYPHIVSKGNQYNMRVFSGLIEKTWAKDRDHSSFNAYYFKKSISLAILHKNTELIVSNSEWYKQVRAYRANIVAYTLSTIFYILKKNYPKLEVNYLKIWNEQRLDNAITEQISILSYSLYTHLTHHTRGTQNVTEWAKKEECWNRVKSAVEKNIITLEHDFLKSLVFKEDNVSETQQERKAQKTNDGIEFQTKVIECGEEYWSRMLSYGMELRILNEFEVSLLKACLNFSKRIPTDKQCKHVLDVREKMVFEGFK